MRTKESDEIINDYLNRHIEYSLDDLTVDQVREYYLSTEPQFKEIDEDFVKFWSYNWGGDESIDLLRELGMTIEICDHFYGITTKEQEAHQRDMKYFEKLGGEAREAVNKETSKFTKKKEWNAFINWLRTNGLIDDICYNTYKKSTARKFMKFIRGNSKVFCCDNLDRYVWNICLFNKKYVHPDCGEDRNLICAKNTYYFYDEVLKYFK